MAFSEVQICNMALSRIGIQQTIDDLEEASNEARACKLFYEVMRDAVLGDFPWEFATKYDSLALVEESPNSDWLFSYRYPIDCLHARRIVSGVGRDATLNPVFKPGNDGAGRLIYTDEEAPTLEYTMRMENPAFFSLGFAEALSYRIASEIAMPLAIKTEIADRNVSMYRIALATATANEANESTPDEESESEFTSVRR